MDSGEHNELIEKAELIATDIITTAGKTGETALSLAAALYSFSEKIIDKLEAQKNIAEKIQCSEGCGYCCYAQVSATPAEAVLIGNFIKENYSLHKRDRLMKKVANNIRLTKGKSLEERIDVWEQTPCIFLEDNKCSIYSVRPFICRAWHSLNAEQCKAAFQSRNHEAEIDSTPFRNYVFGSVRQGLSAACSKAGCESDPIEITTAIKTILNHAAPEEAWIKGKQLFT